MKLTLVSSPVLIASALASAGSTRLVVHADCLNNTIPAVLCRRIQVRSLVVTKQILSRAFTWGDILKRST